jgi:hypothetical protein
VDHSPIESLEGIEHRAVFSGQAAASTHADENPGLYDKMGIEGGVMNLGQRDAVRHHRLAQRLVIVRNDVRRVQEERLRQT